ncbi:hypothetical protein LJC52_01355 [Bacteroidales bacterium OttesenSCG-928-A17]|nr:hypothetical protein [Bacteroidales bacterium OttesenSCG-928-A17]
MENLSEYIPLLIIAASVIVSAVSGSKKKKKGEVSHETRIPGIPPVEYPSDDYKPQPEVISSEKVQVNPRAYTRLTTHSTSSQRDEKPIVLEEEYAAPFIDTSDLDEVKKAVIYTEIFTRKEY